MGAKMVVMKEYYTPTLVLGIHPRNEKDAQIILYTKELGKITAIAKSIRKITSKLAGHLKIGTLANVRVVEAGSSYQLIDGLAVKSPSPDGSLLQLTGFLEDVIPQGQPDIQMWYTISEIFESRTITPKIYRYLLQLMGFVRGREEALSCQGCKKQNGEVVYFYAPDIIFLCSNCLSRVRININDTVPVS